MAQADREEGRRPDGWTREERREVRALRRELRVVKEERDILKKAAAWFARETMTRKFRFMRAHQAEFRVRTMARVLGVSPSGFYAWLRRQPSRRAREDRLLSEAVREAHAASRGVYGAPRVRAELRASGFSVSRKRVARLMREQGLTGVTRRRKFRTTIRNAERRPAPDLVNREFSASAPNQLWVSDITEVPTATRPLYLAATVDAFSRRVVGWAMGLRQQTEWGLVVSMGARPRVIRPRTWAARLRVAFLGHSSGSRRTRRGSQTTTRPPKRGNLNVGWVCAHRGGHRGHRPSRPTRW